MVKLALSRFRSAGWYSSQLTRSNTGSRVRADGELRLALDQAALRCRWRCWCPWSARTGYFLYILSVKIGTTLYGKCSTHRYELVDRFEHAGEPLDPAKTIHDTLYTLLEVKRAEMDTQDIGLRRQPFDHIDCEFDTVVLDFLVIMLM